MEREHSKEKQKLVKDKDAGTSIALGLSTTSSDARA